MTDPHGFLKIPRRPVPARPVEERLDDWREVYAGQALLPLVSEQAGRQAQVAADDLAETAALVATFPGRTREKLARWEEALAAWRRAGRRVVIWGSGSKGVSFLTTVPGASDVVEHAVDINPYRQGYFMSGTGQAIVAPEALRDVKPDVVVVMNRVYVPEIARTLDELGLSPELTAL